MENGRAIGAVCVYHGYIYVCVKFLSERPMAAHELLRGRAEVASKNDACVPHSLFVQNSQKWKERGLKNNKKKIKREREKMRNFQLTFLQQLISL